MGGKSPLCFSFICDFKKSHMTYTSIRKRVALFALASLFVISCDNELRINAPYEVVPVLYGILDYQADTNWVRIGRSYQGGDLGASGGLQQPDSIYLGPLEVFLKEFKGNTLVKTIAMERDESRQLEPGFFTNDGFHLYRTTVALDSTARYVVEVYEASKLLMSASTPMVAKPRIREPLGGMRPVALNRSTGQLFQWDNAVNARLYQSYLRLHYLEVTAPQYDTVSKFLDFILPTQLSDNLLGNNRITIALGLEPYINFLAGNLTTNTNIYRFPLRFDYFLTAAEDQLATYISVKQPATGIVQDKPEFTNINGGVGIFSSRTTVSKLNMFIAEPTIDSLVIGKSACGLRFARFQGLPSPSLCYCDPTINKEVNCDLLPQ